MVLQTASLFVYRRFQILNCLREDMVTVVNLYCYMDGHNANNNQTVKRDETKCGDREEVSINSGHV